MGKIYDYVGLGFGPSNIALAVALEEMGWQGEMLYLEKQSRSEWHPNMLLGGADIQHNPLRDFITLRNPRSKYTFINYLHEQGRLIDYLNLGLDYPFRKDYSKYIGWVASQFDNVEYNCEIASVVLSESAGECGAVYDVITTGGQVFQTRGFVVGHGRSAYIPDVIQGFIGPKVFHFTEYLGRLNSILRSVEKPRKICVVGGSQSAIEIVLDLHARCPQMEIVNVMRGYGYRLRETSPFTRTIFMSSFIDYFHALPVSEKASLRRELHHTNYSVADADAIKKLNSILYEEKLDRSQRVSILNNRYIDSMVERSGRYELDLVERHTSERETLDVDVVIAATGFMDFGSGEKDESLPRTLSSVSSLFALDEASAPCVNRDYSMVYRDVGSSLYPCYLNGLCEHSHGFGDAGTFSTLAFRAHAIAESMMSAVADREVCLSV